MFVYSYYCEITRDSARYQSSGVYIGPKVDSGERYATAQTEIFKSQLERVKKSKFPNSEYLNSGDFTLKNFNLLHEVSK